MKVHFIRGDGNITECGIDPQPIGLVDPFLEVYLSDFEAWEESVKCKRCIKSIERRKRFDRQREIDHQA